MGQARQIAPVLSSVLPGAIENGWLYKADYGPDAVTFELTTWNGYKSIRMVVESGSFTDEQEFVYSGAASDEVVPARYAMVNPGFAFQLYSNYAPDAPFPTWAFLKAVWESDIIPVLVAAIEYFTNGLVGDVSYLEISAAAGNLQQRVAIIPVFTDTEVLILQAAVYGLNNAEGLYSQQAQGIFIPAPMFGSQSFGVSGELARIAQALNDLTKMNRVTWINNEGGFADLLSGDIVTVP